MSLNRGVDEEQVTHVHNGITTLPGQNELMSFAIIEINLEIIMQVKSEREKEISHDVTCRWEWEILPEELIYIWNNQTVLENKLTRWGQGASLLAQMVKNLPAMQETWIWSLGQEDHLEKDTATHSSILTWEIPWAGEAGGPQSKGSQRVGHNWVTNTHARTGGGSPTTR